MGLKNKDTDTRGGIHKVWLIKSHERDYDKVHVNVAC